MEDTSEIHIQIAKDGNKSADFDPHDGKPVTLIVSSPNMEYIATWSSENRSIVGWKMVDNELQLKHEYMISQNDIKYDECSELYFSDNYGPSVSVSDNKLVSVPIYKSDYHDFKVGGYSILTLMKTDQ
ncbi:hypothetical protein C2G38_2186530 [Gigaspora rosea]|uniref:Uncharacterized protein n=1 Tax=Gigaspora rosea TaxID=44941 RepID=A0A397V5A8_9GLOM|nr:hypothetical protein C2G38_2186530 [Gigaspora rosea]